MLKIVENGIETSFEIEFTTLHLRKNALRALATLHETADTKDHHARQRHAHLDSAVLQFAKRPGIDPLDRRGSWRRRLVEAGHPGLGQMVRYDVANVFRPASCVACRLEKNEITKRMSLRGASCFRAFSIEIGPGLRLHANGAQSRSIEPTAGGGRQGRLRAQSVPRNRSLPSDTVGMNIARSVIAPLHRTAPALGFARRGADGGTAMFSGEAELITQSGNRIPLTVDMVRNGRPRAHGSPALRHSRAGSLTRASAPAQAAMPGRDERRYRRHELQQLACLGPAGLPSGLERWLRGSGARSTAAASSRLVPDPDYGSALSLRGRQNLAAAVFGIPLGRAGRWLGSAVVFCRRCLGTRRLPAQGQHTVAISASPMIVRVAPHLVRCSTSASEMGAGHDRQRCILGPRLLADLPGLEAAGIATNSRFARSSPAALSTSGIGRIADDELRAITFGRGHRVGLIFDDENCPRPAQISPAPSSEPTRP